MKRWVTYVLGGLALAAVVAGLVLWQTGTLAALWGDAEPEGDVRTAVVERGPLTVTVLASGQIEPLHLVDLSFEASGRVAELLVEPGSHVAAGELLARLESDRLALQVAQARARLDSAQAQLAELQAGPRPQELAVAEANLAANEAQVWAAAADLGQLEEGASGAQLAAAEADLASAMADQRLAEDTHEAMLQCFTFEMPPTGEERTVCPALGTPEEQARFRLQAADAALEAARLRLDQLLAGADADAVRAARSNVAAAAAQRDAVRAQLDQLRAGSSAGQIALAEASVGQAEAGLREAELALEGATLRAPVSGIVADVSATVGEMASAGAEVITLVDASGFKLIVSVDEIDVTRLAVGQAAEVQVDAFPDLRLAATVERIASSATLDGGVVSYDVLLNLEPSSAPLRADMTANATVIIEQRDDVLTIPTWVVRTDQETGQPYVQRREGDRERRVDVELGERHEGRVEVLEGLSEGDVLIWRLTWNAPSFGPASGG